MAILKKRDFCDCGLKIQKPNSNYCSLECRNRGYLGVHKVNAGTFKKGQPSPRKGKRKHYLCEICEKDFIRRQAGRNDVVKFCGMDCRNVFYRQDERFGRWNLGRKIPEDEKTMRAEAAKKANCGAIFSREDIRKKSIEAHREWARTHPSPLRGRKASWAKGENNYNWKGGITSEDRKERLRFRAMMQKSIFIRDKFSCVICLDKHDLQVDHIKGWSKYPELRFEESNCRTLCKSCHYQITFGKPMKDKNTSWGHNLGRGI